jgi:hypothetical protein
MKRRKVEITDSICMSQTEQAKECRKNGGRTSSPSHLSSIDLAGEVPDKVVVKTK